MIGSLYPSPPTNDNMVARCLLGCSNALTQILYPIPKQPCLRARWLAFLHFEEGGITSNSRLCARHFTEDCFKNWMQYEMGFVKVLHLLDTAVPSVYTVGPSANVKPLTRDVECQCSPKSVSSVKVQVALSSPKPKRRSKAVQVNLSCPSEPTEDVTTQTPPPYSPDYPEVLQRLL